MNQNQFFLNKLSRNKIIVLIIIFLTTFIINAQDISDLRNVNVDDLSDEQIEEIWDEAQNSGYTLEQLTVMARSRGVSAVEIDKLLFRIKNLDKNDSNISSDASNEFDEIEKDSTAFGIKDGMKLEPIEKSPIFGFDFFNNPNITFTPNLNLATPQNYRLGPGDVLRIDVWGASEASYTKKISNEGFIQIGGIGQINLNGMTIQTATDKINSSLRKIYYGISAPENSYSKVYTNVVLESIRSVQVNIIGEVKVPGTYSVSGLSTVLNALYAAGGPTENGTFRSIKIVRNGQLLNYFDFYDYLLDGSETGNVQLKDQDVIIVSPYLSQITIEGQVKRPGIYELKSGETFNDLLKYSSGFTANAYKKSFIIERYTDVQKEVKEFNLTDAQYISLKNGDKIFVKEVLDIYRNRVTLEGAVFHPGNYEFFEGMTVKDLLIKSEGVKKEAYNDKAIIIRLLDTQDKKLISFSINEVMNGINNPELMPEDQVYIYSKDELREKRTISINGAVNAPIKLEYLDGLTVQDMVALAGGFKEGADPHNIEIARRLNDEDFSTIAQSIVVSVNNNLKNDALSKFEIKPYDVITVRYKKGYITQKNVSIEGEVQFPGTYTLQNEEETISDIIKRAGGLTPYAYIDGANLIRIKKTPEKEKQTEVLSLIKERDTLFDNIDPNLKFFKVGIDLNKILNNNKEYDLILEEGDKIIIPKVNQTVEVQGMVFTPSLIQYSEGKGLKYYINNSGGFLDNAKKNNVFVVYQNGKIKTTKNFLFFKTYPPLEPGATVLVPERPEREKLITTQEIIGLTTGFTTLIILLDRLIK